MSKKDITDKIWLSSPHMGGSERKFVDEAFDSNWISPVGPHLAAFEQELCQLLGAKQAVALSSGTAALHLALLNLGVKTGDEVLCQSFTFSASANPIVYVGARPVFIDSEELTWNMDPNLVEDAIKDGINRSKKPKAIIIVHLYGMPTQLTPIIELGHKYDIPVIEDAAEALGSTYMSKPVGTFGVMSIFSFNGNKIITTGGGGALVTANKIFADQARFLATQARDEAPHYEHSQIGYNYRLSNVAAGIGRGQLKVLPKWVEKRRSNYKYYLEVLESKVGIDFLPEPDGYYSNRWLTCLTVDPARTGGVTREKIRMALDSRNIESRPLWKPMHLQPVFKDYRCYDRGISERLFELGLCLPSGSNLGQSQLDRITETIVELLP